ncbi:MAG TPA: hypothetical protein PLK12_01455 [Prolixibacteraceae bacterium]|nr:hypothetical protein [Prolixibacteraceae bacterium]
MDRKLLLCILGLFLLGSCDDRLSDNNVPSFSPGDTIQLLMKETLTGPVPGMALTFDSVLTDSRCPSQVVCVWEGDAAVQLVVNWNDECDTLVLHTHGGNQMPSAVTLNAYRYQLNKLSPYPETVDPIPQSAYKSELIIEAL